MEFHQIRYFAALAETRSYTAAAERCYISRQALRQAVQSMEREYGVTLVENRRNRLYLTPAGELLAGWAEKLSRDWARMDSAMRSFVREPLRLHLGVSISLLPFYAPAQMESINRLRAVFPSLELRYELQDADTLLRRLYAGELDAALLVDLGMERPGLRRTVLRRDRPGILVSAEHPFYSRKSLGLRDLDGQSMCVMSEPGDCFRPLQEALETAGARVDFRVIPESVEAFRAIRREGVLAIDRLVIQDEEAIAMEKDLELTDFDTPLELVLLVREQAAAALQPVVRCLQNGAEG